MSHELEKKVRQLSQILNEDAVAQALGITTEAVRDILEGRASIQGDALRERRLEDKPIIQVSSVKTAYRQRVISVYRAKGGVGATAIAIGVAYLLSKEIKVLLIDLNMVLGGGDISYYLELPDYPNFGGFNGNNLQDCIVEYDTTFHVLQTSKTMNDDFKPNIEKVILQARQDYDAIVLDLPYGKTDIVNEALSYSSTILAVTTGTVGELTRTAVGLNEYTKKEIVVIVNNNQVELTRAAFPDCKIIQIGMDNTLFECLQHGVVPKSKSVFMKGLSQLTDDWLGKKPKKGLLSAFLG